MSIPTTTGTITRGETRASFTNAGGAVSPDPLGGARVTASSSTFSIADTPGRMRMFRALCILGVLIFSIGTTLGLSRQSSGLRHARDHAAQSVRIGTIRTELVKADAIATNSFLVGGLEPPGTRAAFEASVATSTRFLTDASAHDRGDAVVLSAVSEAVNQYVSTMEAARTNNRQLLPVGTAYLKDASGSLRSEILPKLQTLADANAKRIEDDYDAATIAHSVALACLVIALVPLVVTMMWLINATRRTINVGYLTATAVIALTGAVALIGTQRAQHDANAAHDESYVTAITLVQARSNAFDAKSAESLTLISRGSGESYERDFQRAARDAIVQLTPTSGLQNGIEAMRSYLSVHQEIRVLDDDRGDWEGAVAKATQTTAGSSNALFKKFGEENNAVIEGAAGQFRSSVNESSDTSSAMAKLVALAGLFALGVCFVAMTPRLREYR